MTEYEYRDLFFTLVERSETAGLAFLTVVSGYLIVAYLVGADLKRGQAALISALFVGYSTAQILAQLSQIDSLMRFSVTTAELFPNAPISTSPALIQLGYAWPFLELLAMLASLKFMWDIRHPKTE